MAAGQQASAIGNSATSDTENISGSTNSTAFVDATTVMVVTVGPAGKISCHGEGEFDVTHSSNATVTAYGEFVYRPTGVGAYAAVQGEASLGTVEFLLSEGSNGPRGYNLTPEVSGLTPGAAYDVKMQVRQNVSSGATATHTGTATVVGS